MKNNHEYHQLIELRNAIVGKEQACQKLNEINEEKGRLKFTLTEPQKYVPTVYFASKLKEEYEAPYAEREVKKLRRKSALINILWVLFTLVSVAALGFLTYLVAKWSWNVSIGSMAGKSYLGSVIAYETAVGIHLFAVAALSLICTLIAVIVAVRFEDASFDEVHLAGRIGSIIIAIIFGIGGIIAFFASFSYYYSTVSGFWEKVLTAFGSFVGIPKFIVAFALALLPAILLIGTVVIGVLMFYRLYCMNADEYYNVKLQIDYTPLYNSEAYKKAQEQDRKAAVVARADYETYYNQELNNYRQMCGAYDAAVNQYQNILNRCNKTIQNSDILNTSQKNLECINIILYYFESRRAITIREALNQYVQDQRMIRLENQLNTLQREAIQALQTEVDKLSRQLDVTQTAITNEIATINRSLNTQTQKLEKAAQKIREDNERHAKNALETQREIARKVGFIREDLRVL